MSDIPETPAEDSAEDMAGDRAEGNLAWAERQEGIYQNTPAGHPGTEAYWAVLEDKDRPVRHQGMAEIDTRPGSAAGLY